jgi:poly(A) polymerase
MTPAGTIPLPAVMTAPATRRVFAAVTADGAQVRFVGGCVRDALLGRKVKDIDIATDAAPERVMRLLEAAGIRAIPTGIDHGTVTAVIERAHYEITTLRHDVETYGRHAKVAFTDDWMADASRRDFTMNALFCALDGTLFDPFGGMADALAGRVRFVGEPRARITEDVLRLLRFFRFQAHYGRTAPDPAALSACMALAPLLPRLSGERVQGEFLRLLRADDPVPVLRLMVERSIMAHLLPDAVRLDRLAGLIALERDPVLCPEDGDPLRRLAALLPDERAVGLRVAERLRLSNEETERLALLAAPKRPVDGAYDPKSLRRALYVMGRDAVRDLLLLATAEGRLSADGLKTALALADGWEPMNFPIQGRDVLSFGQRPGPQIGRLLKEVERWWEDRDYRPTRQQCLEELRRRLPDAGD